MQSLARHVGDLYGARSGVLGLRNLVSAFAICTIVDVWFTPARGACFYLAPFCILRIEVFTLTRVTRSV